jgi:hypothetical protein
VELNIKRSQPIGSPHEEESADENDESDDDGGPIVP